MGPRALISAIFVLVCSSLGFAREVRPNEIQPFASNFSCSNPLLKWQFDNLVTLYFENQKGISEGRYRGQSIIDSEGSLIGNGSPWMYRGVTNSQFNEAQILRVVFNDSTSVSESRWLTADLYGTNDGSLPLLRQRFQDLPVEEQISKFKPAYLKVKDSLDRESSSGSGATDGTYEHLRIGGHENGTPIAGNFMTPHKDFAEYYGEFVLLVKEVVKRGVDLERYNYHVSGYSIGSIYAHDRDEYFVPSHIPAWDVQAVEVRHGAQGWHRMSYGAPAYFYTKLYRDKNPCDVYAVRVDRGDGGVNAEQRVPVGVLLRCAEGKTCESKWDHALGAEEDTLRQVVGSVKVDGRPIFYLPMKVYKLGDPDTLMQTDLATILDGFDNISANLKQNKELWEHIILNSYASDFDSALKLIDKLPLLSDLQPKIFADLNQKIAAKSIEVRPENLSGFVKMLKYAQIQPGSELTNMFLVNMDKPEIRLPLLNALSNEKHFSPLAGVFTACKDKMQKLDNLTPGEQIALMQSDATAVSDRGLTDYLAKKIAENGQFAAQAFDLIQGDEKTKTDWIVKAVSKIRPHRFGAAGENPDGLMIWQSVSPKISNVDARANLKGAALDLYFSQSTQSPLKIAEVMGTIGLPKGREIDEVRTLWTYAKNFPDPNFNAYKFYSIDIKHLIYDKVMPAAQTREERNDLQTAFVNFYSEAIINPEKVFGFAALRMISEITKSPEPLLLQDQDIKYTLNGQEIVYKAEFINRILHQSMSVGYLEYLEKLATSAKSPELRNRAGKTLWHIVAGYSVYAGQKFNEDLQDSEISKMVAQRYQWNHFENTYVLVSALGQKFGDHSGINSTQTLMESQMPAMKAANDVSLGSMIALINQITSNAN